MERQEELDAIGNATYEATAKQERQRTYALTKSLGAIYDQARFHDAMARNMITLPSVKPAPPVARATSEPEQAPDEATSPASASIFDTIKQGARLGFDAIVDLGGRVADALNPVSTAEAAGIKGGGRGGGIGRGVGEAAAHVWNPGQVRAYRDALKSGASTAEIVAKTGAPEEAVRDRITRSQLAAASIGDDPAKNPLLKLYQSRRGSIGPIDKDELTEFTEGLSKDQVIEITSALPEATYRRFTDNMRKQTLTDHGGEGEDLLNKLAPGLFGMPKPAND